MRKERIEKLRFGDDLVRMVVDGEVLYPLLREIEALVDSDAATEILTFRCRQALPMWERYLEVFERGEAIGEMSKRSKAFRRVAQILKTRLILGSLGASAKQLRRMRTRFLLDDGSDKLLAQSGELVIQPPKQGESGKSPGCS